VSVGHIARVFEQAGIATISFGVRAFGSRMLPMKIPRLVLTPELMGKTLGRPNDAITQRKYLELGLALLEGAEKGDTFIQLERRKHP
jgi:hypothetical protein